MLQNNAGCHMLILPVSVFVRRTKTITPRHYKNEREMNAFVARKAGAMSPEKSQSAFTPRRGSCQQHVYQRMLWLIHHQFCKNLFCFTLLKTVR